MKDEKWKNEKIRWQDLIETEKESCVFVVEKKKKKIQIMGRQCL